MTATPSGAAGAVVAYLRAQRDAIAANEPGVRDGDEDAVHDMRVAIRRLRSTLRSFRGMWERERVDALRGELKWLADKLGPVRDGQVMAARLAGAVRAEPRQLVVGPVEARIQQHLGHDTSDAMERVRGALDGDRYAKLLGEVDAMVGAAADRGNGWVRKRVRKAVRRADRMLDGADAADDHERDVQLHEARKAYKRARYAAEPLDRKPAQQLAKQLKALQDVLGVHQDTVVTRAVLRDLGMRAFREGGNAFTYGLLHARQQVAGETALADLPDAAKRARRKKVRGWLA
ncbi:CHAD domain-containing protein [Phytohabitans sp. LJ34]|uniref:CHAD domain-containing protein n=1 Tax=Phytohabitans sp. LJ34 TaxID=3452217 RepID=UPI003F8ABB71